MRFVGLKEKNYQAFSVHPAEACFHFLALTHYPGFCCHRYLSWSFIWSLHGSFFFFWFLYGSFNLIYLFLHVSSLVIKVKGLCGNQDFLFRRGLPSSSAVVTVTIVLKSVNMEPGKSAIHLPAWQVKSKTYFRPNPVYKCMHDDCVYHMKEENKNLNQTLKRTNEFKKIPQRTSSKWLTLFFFFFFL